MVRFQARAELPAECGTLLLTSKSELAGLGAITAVSRFSVEAQGKLMIYRYDSVAATSYVIFCDRGGSWNLGPWESDAWFLYFQVVSDRVLHLVSCGATFFKFNHELLFRNLHAVDRWEWVKQGGAQQIFCSDPALVDSQAGQLLESERLTF